MSLGRLLWISLIAAAYGELWKKNAVLPSNSESVVRGNGAITNRKALFPESWNRRLGRFRSCNIMKTCAGILRQNKYVQLGGLLGATAVGGYVVQQSLLRPSRHYTNSSVAREYDAWTQEGILEAYWGEHIHLGYYSDAERARGYKKKDFIKAKYDFVDEFFKVDGAGKSDIFHRDGTDTLKVLDVGCGIGGTARYLAKQYGDRIHVTGLSISPQQVARASTLTAQANLQANCEFVQGDALQLTWPNETFDVVYAIESGEHMPDKKRFVEEMTRVLKPGGRLFIACWCQRDNRTKPFNPKEQKMLEFLYAEWTHPYFVSIEHFEELMRNTGQLTEVVGKDWTVPTLPSWRHSVWVGVYNPWPVLKRPHLWWKCVREGVTLERMHGAFSSGLMQYGIISAVKAKKQQQ